MAAYALPQPDLKPRYNIRYNNVHLLFHVIAFIASFNVATINSPQTGTWLMFLLAGCAVSYQKIKLRYLKVAMLAWLITLGISCFIVKPVFFGSATMFTLAATPLLGLTLPKDLGWYLRAFGGVILLYAIAIIFQFIFNIHAYDIFLYDYHWFDEHHPAPAWPLIDPNNTAAVLNCALIPCFYNIIHPLNGMDKNRDTQYPIRLAFIFLTLIFSIALLFTASKAGIAVAVLMCSFLYIFERGYKWWLSLLAVGIIDQISVSWHVITVAFQNRWQIWVAAAPLVAISPWSGLGMATFPYYYNQLKTEHFTAGFWAHNDLLQIAIEMGIPALIVFLCLWGVVLINTSRKNIVSACVLMGVFLQSLVEFQFYVPPIAILCGLALAWHEENYA